MKVSLRILFVFLFRLTAQACIWDADTLLQERLRSHEMASAIFGNPPPTEPAPLRSRIEKLKINPREYDPIWWNDLAGAHLRLGEAKQAAVLLEGICEKFPNDYGVHANLGTAYHLYEAEKEVSRDLEINPAAHFGVEKYHLALLQYLGRDSEYQKKHVYVDEWSRAFLNRPRVMGKPDGKLDLSNSNALDLVRINELENQLGRYHMSMAEVTNQWEWKQIQEIKSQAYSPPSYRFKWNLAADSKFQEGIIYMASMNPNESACYVMLGIACEKKRDFNLAAAAFERAIRLGSPQAEILNSKVESLRSYIKESLKYKLVLWGILSLILLIVLYYIYSKFRARRRKVIASA